MAEQLERWRGTNRIMMILTELSSEEKKADIK